MLTWQLFSEITSRAQNVFIDNANLLKKLSFPRISLPVTVIANALVNFAIVFGLFTAFMLGSGTFPGWPFIAMVPVIAVLVLFAIGLGIALGILNVFFRDVGHFFTIALQFWFWFTPVVYPVAVFKSQLRRAPGDWFVIHSYAVYENRVKANLENRTTSLKGGRG